LPTNGSLQKLFEGTIFSTLVDSFRYERGLLFIAGVLQFRAANGYVQGVNPTITFIIQALLISYFKDTPVLLGVHGHEISGSNGLILEGEA